MTLVSDLGKFSFVLLTRFTFGKFIEMIIDTFLHKIPKLYTCKKVKENGITVRQPITSSKYGNDGFKPRSRRCKCESWILLLFFIISLAFLSFLSFVYCISFGPFLCLFSVICDFNILFLVIVFVINQLLKSCISWCWNSSIYFTINRNSWCCNSSSSISSNIISSSSSSSNYIIIITNMVIKIIIEALVQRQLSDRHSRQHYLRYPREVSAGHCLSGEAVRPWEQDAPWLTCFSRGLRE